MRQGSVMGEGERDQQATRIERATIRMVSRSDAIRQAPKKQVTGR